MPTAGQHRRRFPCRLFLIITLLLDSAFFGAKKGRERGRGQKGAEKEGQGTREPTVTVTQCCQHGAHGMRHPGVLGGYGGHSPAQARADLGNFMSSGQPAAAWLLPWLLPFSRPWQGTPHVPTPPGIAVLMGCCGAPRSQGSCRKASSFSILFSISIAGARVGWMWGPAWSEEEHPWQDSEPVRLCPLRGEGCPVLASLGCLLPWCQHLQSP